VVARPLSVPGIVTPDADRIGRVAAKVVGTVAELRKRLGDSVAKGEVVAVLVLLQHPPRAGASIHVGPPPPG